MAKSRAQIWLEKHAAEFQSSDNLPGAFLREALFTQIRPGRIVGIVDSRGSIRSGRAMLRGPAGWVLDLGGPHGTPGIADDVNTVYVSRVVLTRLLQSRS